MVCYSFLEDTEDNITDETLQVVLVMSDLTFNNSKGLGIVASLLTISTILVLVLGVTTNAAAAEGEGSWFQVSLGYLGMAMDDINEADFRWHDDSPDGFNLGKMNSGMALSFGLGYDMSPSLGYGLFWEHQYASTSGTDGDLTADVNLAADTFSGRLNYNFVTQKSWRLGLAGSLGYLVVGGDVNKTTSGASFGETDLAGNTWALEGMAVLEFVVGESSTLQVTAGWRDAKVTSFRSGSATVVKDDGQDMSLDYTGFTARVGWKYRFGSLDDQTVPDIK